MLCDKIQWKTSDRRGPFCRFGQWLSMVAMATILGPGLAEPVSAQDESCTATLARTFDSRGGARFMAEWDDEVEVQLRIVVNCLSSGSDVQRIEVEELLPDGLVFAAGDPAPGRVVLGRPRWELTPDEVGPLVEIGLWYTVRVRPSGLPQTEDGEVRLTWPSKLAIGVGRRTISLETAEQPALRVRSRRVDAGCHLDAIRRWEPARVEPGEPITTSLELVARDCRPFRARPEVIVALQPPEATDQITRTVTMATAFADAIEPTGGLFGTVLNAIGGPVTSLPGRDQDQPLDVLRAATVGEGGDAAAAIRAALDATVERPLHHSVVIYAARPATPRASPAALTALLDEASRRDIELVNICIGAGACDPTLVWDKSYTSLNAARFNAISGAFDKHFGPTLNFVGLEVAERMPANMRAVADSSIPAAILGDGGLIWPLEPMVVATAATWSHSMTAATPLGALFEGRGTVKIVYSDGALLHRSEQMVLPRSALRVGIGVEPERCVPVTDKTVYPPTILLGERVEVRLDLTTTCAGLQRRSDVILALDISGSMTVDKMADLKSASRRLTERLDGTASRMGIITFNESIRSLVPLSRDFSHIFGAIDSAGGPDGAGYGFTNVAIGLNAAQAELEHRRIGADASVVLMSDGETSADGMLAAAARLRAELVEVFTVCFGGKCPETLRQTATSADHYFEIFDSAALEALLETLGARLGEVALESARIEDVLGPDVRLVPGSVDPAPSGSEGSVLTWDLAGEALDYRTRVRYEVEPLRIGSVPTNERAHADFVDALGRPGRADFPVPSVDVLQHGDDGPCEPSLAQSGPELAVLGDTFMKRLDVSLACPGRDVRLDIVLAIDHSDSMRFESRLENAVAAAQAFLDAVESEDARVGLIAFATNVSVSLPLASDLGPVRGALSALMPGGTTSISTALSESGRLFDAARPDALTALVLLTDGREAAGGTAAMLARAAELKDAGIGIVTVCAGECDPELVEVASRPSHAFDASERDELIRLFRELADEFAHPRPENVLIRDAFPPALKPVEGGSTPIPHSMSTPQAEWRLPELPLEGAGFDVGMLSVEPGTHPLSRFARIDYDFGLSRRGWAYFPLPDIEIITPTPSAIPSALPTRTPTATRTPWPSETPDPGDTPGTPGATGSPEPTEDGGTGASVLYLPWTFSSSPPSRADASSGSDSASGRDADRYSEFEPGRDS